jgi:hypothetical protein
MREVATGFCSPWRVDDGDNDCLSVTIFGPGGGTRFCGILYPIQARELRDQLDLALIKIADARARRPVYVVVDNAGYEGEQDLHEATSYEAALQWRRENYDGDVIAERHIEVARDIAGERSYEL